MTDEQHLAAALQAGAVSDLPLRALQHARADRIELVADQIARTEHGRVLSELPGWQQDRLRMAAGRVVHMLTVETMEARNAG